MRGVGCWLGSRRGWWRGSESSNTNLSNFGYSRNDELKYVTIAQTETLAVVLGPVFVIWNQSRPVQLNQNH